MQLLEVLGLLFLVVGVSGLVWTVAQLLRARPLDCCGKCGYPTIGLPTERCPECGSNWTTYRGARRYWGRALVLVLVAAGWSAGLLAAGSWADSALQARYEHWDLKWELYVVADGGFRALPFVLRMDEKRAAFKFEGQVALGQPSRVWLERKGLEDPEARFVLTLPDLATPNGAAVDSARLVRWWATVKEEGGAGVVAGDFQIVLDFLSHSVDQRPLEWAMSPREDLLVAPFGGVESGVENTVWSESLPVCGQLIWLIGLVVLCRVVEPRAGATFTAAGSEAV